MAVGICEVDENKMILRLDRDWLGQGWGFKDEDAFEYRPKAPCYVPELSDKVYTREDFINLCDNQSEIAKIIFHLIDWQSPETLLDEEIVEGELTICKNCGRMFKSFWSDECSHCGAINCKE